MSQKLTQRKQQAMEMRSRIQAVALDLFDRESFANVSVEEIAQAAGCSVGNIYHYFKSKDELLIQVIDHVDRAYEQLEEEDLADKSHTGREKLLDFIGRSLRISVDDPVLYKAFIHALRYPEQGSLKLGPHRVYYRLLKELAESCLAEGAIHPSRSADDVVEALVTLHRGTLMEWRIYEGNFALEERGRALGELLLRGLAIE